MGKKISLYWTSHDFTDKKMPPSKRKKQTNVVQFLLKLCTGLLSFNKPSLVYLESRNMMHSGRIKFTHKNKIFE